MECNLNTWNAFMPSLTWKIHGIQRHGAHSRYRRYRVILQPDFATRAYRRDFKSEADFLNFVSRVKLAFEQLMELMNTFFPNCMTDVVMEYCYGKNKTTSICQQVIDLLIDIESSKGHSANILDVYQTIRALKARGIEF
jgi:hypothetical protein